MSVIIVGRNEELYIRTVLESVLGTDYPPDLIDFCYVDDHSTDGTFYEASRISQAHPGRLQVLRAPDAGIGKSPKKSALAYGIESTKGEIILFTDADSKVDPGWVRSMVSEYDERTGAVAGPTLPVSQRSIHERVYRAERFLVALTSASAIGLGSPASVSGQSFSFRRRVYEEIGGYAFPQIASGDDDLMAQKIAKRGWRVNFCSHPGSMVTDLRPPTVVRHLAAETRHQSTIRYYPMIWRFAYLITILSGWLLLAAAVWSLFRVEYLSLVAVVFGAKVCIDAVGAYVFARRLRITLPVHEFLLAEILLPIYLVVRPLLAFKSGFVWQGRSHSQHGSGMAEAAS